jgi:uncharacterized membrane protein required for colicin V production
MLLILSIVVVLIVAGSQYRNGIFTSATMLIQVLLAGLVAFGLWEPLADELDGLMQTGRLAGFEDCMALTGLFAGALLGLRLITNRINKEPFDFNPIAQQFGGPAIGLITGYLVSGFLICVLQTLPLDEEFLGFTPRRPDESNLRSYFPADRVWLAMMRRAGAYPFAWAEDNPNVDSPFDRWATFDRAGTFELRYLRFRRHAPGREPVDYRGEFGRELARKK